MDLTVETTDYGSDSRRWLGSAHGFEAAPSITLKSDLFTPTFTDGRVPSGVALGKVTASGLYGPYSNAATDGRQTLAGHLKTAVKVTGTRNIGAALIEHGAVIVAELPENHGLDAAGQAEAAGRIIYR